jgi:hypothetical protein
MSQLVVIKYKTEEESKEYHDMTRVDFVGNWVVMYPSNSNTDPDRIAVPCTADVEEVAVYNLR